MKPTKIIEMLDLAYVANKANEKLTPMFTGEAGLGKSEICQQWVGMKRKSNPDFGFIDLRIAYMEQPDLIGFPETDVDESGTKRTFHRLPSFWPTEGEGLLLFEEPNRGTTGVMNCLMQILTDRKVHNYTLPPGWIMAACINPDSAEYDVNAMDPALRNRFVEFVVEYDHNTFVEFMEKQNWDEMIQAFIKSGTWIYKDTKSVGKEGTYISPRTWSKMQAAHIAGGSEDKQMHDLIARSILGKDVGKEFWTFCHQQSPIMASDLLKDKPKSLDRLRSFCDKSNYRGDLISATIQSIVQHYGGPKGECPPDQIDEDTMAEVAQIIPSDQAINLIRDCGFKHCKGQVTEFFKDFVKRHPELLGVLKQNIKINVATKVDK